MIESRNTADILEKIFNEGKYIGVRQFYNHLINLYLINDTFYEIWYFRDENQVTKVERLDDNKKLDLYINDLNKKK